MRTSEERSSEARAGEQPSAANTVYTYIPNPHIPVTQEMNP